jgi:hypothetical protein
MRAKMALMPILTLCAIKERFLLFGLEEEKVLNLFKDAGQNP